jgi:hypothetical protein
MKNIIICSDDTLQSPTSGTTAAHILRIARSIASELASGHKQVTTRLTEGAWLEANPKAH